MLALTNGPQFRYTALSDLLGTKRLRYEPTGWDALGISLERDPKTHGMTTEYSAQLGFVKDGRAYLSRAYQAAGVEADVRVRIEQLDPNAFAWLPYYEGRVNFTTAEFSSVDVKANLEQQSWLQKFLSRDSVSVDLLGNQSVSGSTGPRATLKTVELHSRAILQRYAASQKGNTDLGAASMFGGNGDASHEQLLYFGFNTAETNELGLGAVNGGFVAGAVAEAVPIYTAPGSGELQVDLALYFHVEAHAQDGLFYRQFRTVDAQFHFRVKTATSDTTTLLRPNVHVENLLGDYTGDEAIGPRTFSFPVHKGDEVYLYADYFVHELDGGLTDPYQATLDCTMLPGSYLRLTATTQTEPTTTTGLLLYEAFDRLCQALTDEVDVFRSDFFGRPDCRLPYPTDGAGALTLLTGAFQVRGFPLLTDAAPAAGDPDPRKTLYTTWRELFDSCAAIWNLGWGVEWVVNTTGELAQVIRVEPLSYWYPADVALDLSVAGPVDDSTKVDEARHYQLVETGYENWQAEQANGLDEYNSSRQWTTPLTRVSNAYQAKSKLATSGILLETTRRNRYDATATQDTSQDALNFLVCLLRASSAASGFETERNQLATVLTGVLSPATVYNLRLSPARLRQRHAPAFLAGIVPLAASQVRYTTGEGNVAMVSQLAGEAAPLAENGTVAVTSLPAPLWRAEQISLKGVPVRREQLRTLLARPTGRVRYRDFRGRVREGWVLTCKHQAADETADFTLLPCLA